MLRMNPNNPVLDGGLNFVLTNTHASPRFSSRPLIWIALMFHNFSSW